MRALELQKRPEPGGISEEVTEGLRRYPLHPQGCGGQGGLRALPTLGVPTPGLCRLPGARKPEIPSHRNEGEDPSETWGCFSS